MRAIELELELDLDLDLEEGEARVSTCDVFARDAEFAAREERVASRAKRIEREFARRAFPVSENPSKLSRNVDGNARHNASRAKTTAAI